MKIGYSYGRCLRDIVAGQVKLEDVVVIITRTRLKFPEEFDDVWYIYSQFGNIWFDYGQYHKDTFFNLTMELHNSGRLFQPRQCDVDVHLTSITWQELGPTDIELAKQDNVVIQAWNHYTLVNKLYGSK
jgi:hypothetical protein